MNNNNYGGLPPLRPAQSGLPPLHSQPMTIPNSTSVTTSAGRGYGTTTTTKNETTITTNNVGQKGMMGQPSYPANSSNMLGRGSVQNNNNNLPTLTALPQLNQNQGRQPVPQQRYNYPSSQNITQNSDVPVILKKNQKPEDRPIFEAKY